MTSGLWAEQFEAQPYPYSEFEEEAGWSNREFAAEASAPQAQAQQRVQQHQVANAQLMKAISTMHRHIRQREGVFHFAGPGRTPQEVAARLRIPPPLALSLLNSIKHWNSQLRSGQSRTSEFEIALGEVPQCRGRTGVKVFWWGVRVWLNECHTGQFLDAMRIGGGFGTLCSAIVPVPQVKLVCGILAATAAIGGGTISLINRRGGNTGIVITRPWIIPPMIPLPAVVWHQ